MSATRPSPHPVAAALLRHDLDDGSWWWSPESYALHGFGVGEVVPTTDLVLSHVHADDRDAWWSTLRSGDTTPRHIRLLDARGGVRHVVGLARQEDRTVEATLLDVTHVVRTEGARVATEQITAATASRATIEQAKGVVAAAYGVDPEAAFDLLRETSMRSNVTLRRLAELVLAEVQERRAPVEEVVAWLGRLVPAEARGDRDGREDGLLA